ncbi:hypothetical protein AHAS_Ahas03G0242700 [Arachis hypogaea]
MKCKFKPNPKMGLKSEEIQAAAFIFSAELDPGEELLKIGDVTATRKDFESLCPTQQISEKILYLTALKCVHNQTLLTWKNVWQLPPTFADTILDGNNLDEILVPMVKQFMQPTKDLQFIYIPMRENEHRYLMVISIHDSIIWQLDSYLEDDDIQRRRTKMTTVAATVEHILKSDIYNECKLEMKETCGDGEFMLQEESLIDIKCIITFTKYKMDCMLFRDSPSWVLQWMNLEHAFDAQCSEVHVLDENGTRMYTAMQLFHGRFNELKAEIAPLVQEFWNMHAEDDDY